MPSTFSVTVRDEESGETFHLAKILADSPADAVDTANSFAHTNGAPQWQPGSAVIDFYQLDPELDSFSYGYYSRLEDAQADGLRWYAEHMAVMSSPIGELAYVQAPKNELDPDAPDIWNIVDAGNPLRHITMMQIVKCDLWTSRQTRDDAPLPEPMRRPES